MFLQYGTQEQPKPDGEAESQLWANELERYLTPYRERLDAYVDRRVVGNLIATVAAIVHMRTNLTQTELGSAITDRQHAQAGTQRLTRALHHQGWDASLIEQVQWDQAERFRQQLEQQGELPLCIWDSSVLEKPESVKLEGLRAVRSSRVRRWARSRPGVFNRPGLPVSVRGEDQGKRGAGGSKRATSGGQHALVDTRKRGSRTTTPGASRAVAPHRPALGLPGASLAKPGRSRAANGLGERPGCCGIRIFGCIAARGCSPCQCVTQTLSVLCA